MQEILNNPWSLQEKTVSQQLQDSFQYLPAVWILTEKSGYISLEIILYQRKSASNIDFFVMYYDMNSEGIDEWQIKLWFSASEF